MSFTFPQIRQLAAEIRAHDFKNGAALGYLTGTMRAALVDARCFNVCRQRESVTVAEMDELRSGVNKLLCTAYGDNFFD